MFKINNKDTRTTPMDNGQLTFIFSVEFIQVLNLSFLFTWIQFRKLLTFSCGWKYFVSSFGKK